MTAKNKLLVNTDSAIHSNHFCKEALDMDSCIEELSNVKGETLTSLYLLRHKRENRELSQTSSLNRKQNARKLRLKTPEELKFLEEQFLLDPSWSRQTVQICKKALNLKTNKIYKWGFDRKLLNKKRGIVLPQIVDRVSFNVEYEKEKSCELPPI